MPSADPRFVVFAPAWTPPEARVQICRNYDGRVFSMSITEARDIGMRLIEAADRSDADRSPAPTTPTGDTTP